MTNEEARKQMKIPGDEVTSMVLDYLSDKLDSIHEDFIEIYDRIPSVALKRYEEKVLAYADMQFDTLVYIDDLYKRLANDFNEKNYWYYEYLISEQRKKVKNIVKLRKKYDAKVYIAKGGKPSKAFHDLDLLKEVPIENFIPTGSKSIKTMKHTKYCCLFHNEKTPSMIVDKENKFHCFGCGKHGTVIDIVMHVHRCEFKEACDILAKYS